MWKKLNMLPLLALIAFGLMSCNNDRSMESLESEIEEISSKVTSGPLAGLEIFKIDGKETRNIKQVKSILNTAYVKDFNYINKTLSVFTSEAEYDKAVAINPYWQKQASLQREPNAFRKKSSNNYVTTDASVHHEDHVYEDLTEAVIVHYESIYSYYNGNIIYTAYPDLDNETISGIRLPVNSEFLEPNHQFNFYQAMVRQNNGNDIDMRFTNTFQDLDLAVRFYKDPNYTGGYTQITLLSEDDAPLNTSVLNVNGQVPRSIAFFAL